MTNDLRIDLSDYAENIIRDLYYISLRPEGRKAFEKSGLSKLKTDELLSYDKIILESKYPGTRFTTSFLIGIFEDMVRKLPEQPSRIFDRIEFRNADEDSILNFEHARGELESAR